MGLTITQKADTLGTIRFVCVRSMEMLAAWVPTSPELEVKTLFGRHIWELAQHADQIGRRTVELRAKLHYERPPVDAYREALQFAREAAASGDRIAAFYDALLPDLRRRLERYIDATDALLDAPTLDIVRRMLGDFDRMERDRAAVARQRTDLASEPLQLEHLRARLAACEPFVDFRESAAA